jgi:hypothetical protein
LASCRRLFFQLCEVTWSSDYQSNPGASASRLIFFRASYSVGKVAGGHTVAIGRKAFKIWLTASIVWIIAIITAIYAGAVFPVGYQANFPLRTDLEPWNDEWPINGPLRHPLYEIIRSPRGREVAADVSMAGIFTFFNRAME